MLTAFMHVRHQADGGASRRQTAALTVLMTVLFLTFPGQYGRKRRARQRAKRPPRRCGNLQWVVSTYALTFAAAMLAFGMVGDEFGRKRAMLTGIAVFCAGSVLATGPVG